MEPWRPFHKIFELVQQFYGLTVYVMVLGKKFCVPPAIHIYGFLGFCLQTLFSGMNIAEAHSEPCQTSRMECFSKIVNG